jgi:hypothetical protein
MTRLTRQKHRWDRYDTHLILVGLAFMGAITGLAFAPNWLRILVIVLAPAGMFFGFWWAGRKPLTETDRYCDRVDQDLDRQQQIRHTRGGYGS